MMWTKEQQKENTLSKWEQLFNEQVKKILIKAFSIRVLATVRYGAKIKNWTIEDLEWIDRKKLKNYEICIEDCTQDLL